MKLKFCMFTLGSTLFVLLMCKPKLHDALRIASLGKVVFPQRCNLEGIMQFRLALKAEKKNVSPRVKIQNYRFIIR